MFIIFIEIFLRYQRAHLHEFLRMRSSSSIGSCASLTESIGEWTSNDIVEDDGNDSDGGIQLRSRLPSVGKNSISPTFCEASNHNELVNKLKFELGLNVALHFLTCCIKIARIVFLVDALDCFRKRVLGLFQSLTKQIESLLGMGPVFIQKLYK